MQKFRPGAAAEISTLGPLQRSCNFGVACIAGRHLHVTQANPSAYFLPEGLNVHFHSGKFSAER